MTTAQKGRPDYINRGFLRSNDSVYLDDSARVDAQRQVVASADKTVAVPGALDASGLAQSSPELPDLGISGSGKKVVLLTPQPLEMPKSDEHLVYKVHALSTFVRRFPAITLNSTGNALTVGGAALAPIVRRSFVASGRLSRSNEATGLDHLNAFSSEARGELFKAEALPHNWKIVNGELLKSAGSDQWQGANPPGEASHFSVVEARGNEIWAGTVHATVLHSRDGGTTWDKLSLGSGASGEVTAIQIDGMNLEVSTSDHQVWMSNDSGRNWSLQERN